MDIKNFHESLEYQSKKKLWETASDLFEGDQSLMADKYLVKHSIERENNDPAKLLWQTRKQRSYYTTHLSKIYQRYIGILFKEPVMLDDDTRKLLESNNAINDIDSEQNDLTEFLKYSIFYSRFNFGDVYIIVDAPNIQTQTGTKLEADMLGKRPYVTMLNPLQIKDYKKFKSGRLKGQFEWLRYEYQEEAERTIGEAPKLETFSKIYEYNATTRVYSITTYKHGKDKVDQVGEPVLQADFDRIPISFICNTKVNYVKDVIPETLKCYNYDSCISNILHFQGYQDKTITGNINDDFKKAMGEYITSFLPEGATITVIDPCNPIALREERDRAELNIWKIAFNLSRVVSSDSKAVEGAETQRVAKQDLLAILVSELHKLEKLLNSVIKDFALFAGNPDFQGQVTLDKDLDIEDVREMLEIELAYMDDINKNPAWKKEILKKKAKMMNLSNEGEVLKEIDTMKVEATPSADILKSINNTDGI